jgi:ComF family protein
MPGIHKLMDIILPPVCMVCGARGQQGRDLCHDCSDLLEENRPACPRCALPMDHGFRGDCGHCLRKPPPYDSSWAYWRYQSPLDGLLLGLKYHRQLPVARLLGGMMADYLQGASMVWPQALVPVPLHVSRVRERGFNQSIELFAPVGRALNVPLLRDSVIRHQATPSQVGLSRVQRCRNLRGVFRVRGDLPEHVAIVDDVVTTGSTVSELARVLRRSGVRRIDVWSVARADEPHSVR